MGYYNQQVYFNTIKSVGWAFFLCLNLFFLILLLGAIVFSYSADLAITSKIFEFFKTAEGEIIGDACFILTTLFFIKKATGTNNTHELKKFLGIRAINLFTLLLIVTIGYCFHHIEIWFEEITNYVNYFDLDFSKGIAVQLYPYSSVLWFISLCIVAPIVEEVIFRGMLQQRLINSGLGVWSAIIITSIAFCLIHTHYGFGLLALMPLALLLGYVRHKTDNLFYCIALHAQYNLFAY